MPSFESLYPVFYVAIILVLTYTATKIVGLIIGGIFRSGIPIVVTQVKRLVTALIWVFGVLLALETIGLRMDLILLVLGLAGIAAIVGFKDVIQNIVARYFSDVYVPFKIGDDITVLGSTGKVVGINSICTVLLDRDEKIVSIPNSTFIREPIVNVTPSAWKEIIVPIDVPADVDIAEFEAAVLKFCNKLKMYWDERFPPLFIIKSRDERNIRMELILMANALEKKETAAAEINRKIMDILQKSKRRA